MGRQYVSGLERKMFRAAFISSAFNEFILIAALTVDSIIVCAALGETEMAAVGVAAPFFFLVGIPACCLGGGLSTVCAQEMGRGHLEEVNQRFNETLLFSVLSMVTVTGIVLFSVPQLAWLFGARGSMAALQGLTSQYLYGLGFELLPFVVQAIVIPIVILDNGTPTVVLSSILGCAANILTDLLTVRNDWGLFGIGLASTMSVVVSLSVLLINLLRKDRVIHFRLVKVRLRHIGEVIRLGMPQAFHTSAGAARSWLLNTLVMAVGGSIGMTVMGIHNTMMDFVDIAAVGIAGATSVMSGIAYGEMNGEELIAVNKLAHRYILIVSAVLITVLATGMQPLGCIFMEAESSGFPLLMFAIGCIAAGVLPGALIYNRVTYLQAVDKPRSAQWIELFANLIVLVALAFALSRLFGIYGVFASFPASKILVMIAIRLKYMKKSRKLFPSPQDSMGLEPTFFHTARDVIFYSVTNLDECMLATEQIGRFCTGHRMQGTVPLYAAMCAEEILTNIFFHGAGQTKRVPRIELRVTIAGNRLIMRIQDSGREFHINALARIITDEKDPYANIGLKIICDTADDVSYYRVFNMNTTLITITSKAE